MSPPRRAAPVPLRRITRCSIRRDAVGRPVKRPPHVPSSDYLVVRCGIRSLRPSRENVDPQRKPESQGVFTAKFVMLSRPVRRPSGASTPSTGPPCGSPFAAGRVPARSGRTDEPRSLRMRQLQRIDVLAGQLDVEIGKPYERHLPAFPVRSVRPAHQFVVDPELSGHLPQQGQIAFQAVRQAGRRIAARGRSRVRIVQALRGAAARERVDLPAVDRMDRPSPRGFGHSRIFA